MSKLATALNLIKNNRGVFCSSLLKNFNFLFSDRLYLQLLFRFKMGYRLDIDNPKTFSEKLQWLKVYDHNPLYTTLVDKYAVKKWVADKIGEKYIIPTLGVWNDAREIDFDKLPNQFVLKTTNGGGGNVKICKDKSSFDRKKAITCLNRDLKKSIYKSYREWPYKNVPPRIIAEKYMEDVPNEGLRDYKFYCFEGIPLYCQVISNRYSKETIDFFDMDWNHQEFTGLSEPHKPFSNSPIPIPIHFDMMKQAVSLIARNIENNCFVRVDFYNVRGENYFGEITFYPASGLGSFSPNEWNYRFGELLKLPSKR